MSTVQVLAVTLVVAAVIPVVWLIYATRDRLDQWLERRRLSGLVFLAIGALMFFGPGPRGLGAIMGFAGLAFLALERSNADPAVVMRRVYLLLIAFAVAMGTWGFITTDSPRRWFLLAFAAVILVVPAILLRSAPRPLNLSEARRLERVRDSAPAPRALPEPLQFGQNAPQVEAFLARLERLTPAQWKTVISREEKGVGWQRWLGVWPFLGQRNASRALERTGRERERADVLVAVSDLVGADFRRDLVATRAAEALVVRDRLDDRHFAALYAPFEPFIPIGVLGLPPLGNRIDAHRPR